MSLLTNRCITTLLPRMESRKVMRAALGSSSFGGARSSPSSASGAGFGAGFFVETSAM